VRKADNLLPSCAVVTKSGSLNFLETSGPVQARNGTALPLPLPLHVSSTCSHETYCETNFVHQVLFKYRDK